jgi:hypothetical protein
MADHGLLIKLESGAGVVPAGARGPERPAVQCRRRRWPCRAGPGAGGAGLPQPGRKTRAGAPSRCAWAWPASSPSTSTSTPRPCCWAAGPRRLSSIAAAVHVILVPLLIVATAAQATGSRSIQVSRRARLLFGHAAAGGATCCSWPAVGYYVRYFGGDWGRALQLALLAFASVVALLVLVLSASLRHGLRVFISKHFFSYRYDYREEWLKFTAMLASNDARRRWACMSSRPGQHGRMPRRRAVDPQRRRRVFVQTAAAGTCHRGRREPCRLVASASSCAKGWVIDMDEYRNATRRYEPGAAHWLLANERDLGWSCPLPWATNCWASWCWPPAHPIELDWEVRDLVKTASRRRPATWRRCRPPKPCWRPASSTPSTACRPSSCTT